MRESSLAATRFSRSAHVACQRSIRWSNAKRLPSDVGLPSPNGPALGGWIQSVSEV